MLFPRFKLAKQKLNQGSRRFRFDRVWIKLEVRGAKSNNFNPQIAAESCARLRFGGSQSPGLWKLNTFDFDKKRDHLIDNLLFLFLRKRVIYIGELYTGHVCFEDISRPDRIIC